MEDGLTFNPVTLRAQLGDSQTMSQVSQCTVQQKIVTRLQANAQQEILFLTQSFFSCPVNLMQTLPEPVIWLSFLAAGIPVRSLSFQCILCHIEDYGYSVWIVGFR